MLPEIPLRRAEITEDRRTISPPAFSRDIQRRTDILASRTQSGLVP